MSEKIPFKSEYAATAHEALHALARTDHPDKEMALLISERHSVSVTAQHVKHWRKKEPAFIHMERQIGFESRERVFDFSLRLIRDGRRDALHKFMLVCDPNYDPRTCTVSDLNAFVDGVEASRASWLDLYLSGMQRRADELGI